MQWSYLHFVKTPDEIFCWVSTDWCLVDLYCLWSTSEHPTVDVESRTVNGAHEIQSQTSTHLHAVVALSLSFSLLKETHWVGLGLAKRGSQTSGNRSRRWRWWRRIESCGRIRVEESLLVGFSCPHLTWQVRCWANKAIENNRTSFDYTLDSVSLSRLRSPLSMAWQIAWNAWVGDADAVYRLHR